MQQNILKAAVTLAFAILFFECSNVFAGCDQFFYGNPWPMIENDKRDDVVKLCQTQLPNRRYPYWEGKVVFATLYSTKYKIPIYTANVVNINGSKGFDRHDCLWNRVATALCDINTLPQHPINSEIGQASGFQNCEDYQALNSDFKKGCTLEKGHLSPSSINSRDREKQDGTFTLTNAAPQYPLLNRGWWRVVERITEKMIQDLVPNQDVYIMTGTFGVKTDENGHDILMNNRVAVPESFWKAVCYPGNSTHNPWGYAAIGRNTPDRQNAENKYMLLKNFSKYFRSGPFDMKCLNAGMGPFYDRGCTKRNRCN